MKVSSTTHLFLLYCPPKEKSSTEDQLYIAVLKKKASRIKEQISKYPCSKETKFDDESYRDQVTEVTPHTYYLENDRRPVNHPERAADEHRERARAFAVAKEQEKKNNAARTEVKWFELEIRFLEDILHSRRVQASREKKARRNRIQRLKKKKRLERALK